jgi:hypothetical protein
MRKSGLQQNSFHSLSLESCGSGKPRNGRRNRRLAFFYQKTIKQLRAPIVGHSAPICWRNVPFANNKNSNALHRVMLRLFAAIHQDSVYLRARFESSGYAKAAEFSRF